MLRVIVTSLVIAMAVSSLSAGDLSKDEPTTQPASDQAYDEDNDYHDLAIDVDATFEWYVHDPEDEKKCSSSHVEFRFTVSNQGDAAASTRGVRLYWRTNMADELWPVEKPRSVPPGERNPDGTGWMGDFFLPPQLPPGQSVEFVKDMPVRGMGKWHPIIVEARLGAPPNDGWPHDYRYVGRFAPFSRSINLNVADVAVPKGGIQIIADEREGSDDHNMGARVQVAATGGAFDGPVSVSIRIRCDADKVEQDEFRRYRHRTLWFKGKTEEGLGGATTLLMGPTVFSRDVLNLDDVRVVLMLGCPKHGLASPVFDADPSNNIDIRGAGDRQDAAATQPAQSQPAAPDPGK
jgi:hypothetical protein